MERLKVTGGKVPHVVPACLPRRERRRVFFRDTRHRAAKAVVRGVFVCAVAVDDGVDAHVDVVADVVLTSVRTIVVRVAAVRVTPAVMC